MNMKDKILGKNVCLELKNGSKYFGVVKEIDDTPEHFSWIILDIKGKENIFADSEVMRVEVLD